MTVVGIAGGAVLLSASEKSADKFAVFAKFSDFS